MAYDSGKRLLLYALVKGLGDAVRRNDQSAARTAPLGHRTDCALGDIKVSGSKRVQVPPSGFYVATLVTNDVISVEGDQRVLRHTGDSWVVPAGQPLVLEPQGKNHTVLLEVFRVEPSPTR
jgi:hypothetical protein